MNARQKAKKQKKEIRALKSDNALMRDIIADSPAMQELYDAYNRPAFVIHSPIQFQEFRARRTIPVYMADIDGVIDHAKQVLADQLFESIKEEYITYEVDTDCRAPIITASICVGAK